MTMPRLTIQRLGLADVNSSFNAIEDLTLEQVPGEIAESVMSFDAKSPNTVFAGPSSGTDLVEPEFRALVSADLPDNGVTNAKIRDSGALSVIGRSANSSGDPADISASAASGAVLRESGSTIGFGTIAAAAIGSGTLALARGGTNADLSGTGGTSQFLRQNSAGAAITVVRPQHSDLSDDVAPTTVTYNAANFTASAGNWTVDDADEVVWYAVQGKLMTINFAIIGTDVSAAPVELRMAIPGGYTCAVATTGVTVIRDAGAASGFGVVVAQASVAYLVFWKDLDSTAWTTTAADDTTVLGQITFQVS